MLMLIMNDGCVSSVPKVQDMINKIDDGSGFLDFSDFCLVMGEKNKEQDQEIHFKDTFRVFSKDEEGQGFFAIQSDWHAWANFIQVIFRPFLLTLIFWNKNPAYWVQFRQE